MISFLRSAACHEPRKSSRVRYSLRTLARLKSVNDLVAKGVTHVKYDLSNLNYIQSLGLGIIMWSYVELDSQLELLGGRAG